MRVGLIGWAVQTGLGSLNRDFSKQPWVRRWLIPKHPRLGFEAPPAATRSAEVAFSPRHIPEPRWHWLTSRTDVVLFAELPYVSAETLRRTQLRGVKIACVPMTDNLRWDVDWVSFVDLFYCPTQYSLETMLEVRRRRGAAGLGANFRLAGGSWGIDTTRFQFRQRTKVEKFLFVNGWGGTELRKGLGCLLAAAPKLPKASVLVVSQQPLKSLPPALVQMPNIADNTMLYSHGDVLLSPSRFEGLGLQYYEAQSCGLPVVVTDAAPMNECGPYRVLAAECRPAGRVDGGGCGPSYDVKPDDLVRVCHELYGTDIVQASVAARVNAELRHDSRAVLADLQRELASLVGVKVA